MKLLSLFLLISATFVTASPKWIVYEKCVLVDDKYFDGDSFNVKAATGYTYIFRLYGVDCPETDTRVPARLKAQAQEFGLTETKDLIKWGKEAQKFTKKFLEGEFTVLTLKKKAAGQSKKSRYYAVIINKNGARLDEALIAAGLARAYGMGAEWPDRMTEKRFIIKLHTLESKAKRADQGIWADSSK